MPIIPGTKLSHYEIISPLGAGGMGEVYLALDQILDRQVAIKVLPEHLGNNPSALSRFEREAKAIAALSHPNILSIHEFGSHQGVSFAVAELLEGETFKARISRSVLPIDQVPKIAAAVAEGLAAAHSKGVVHRDLKPENRILVGRTLGWNVILGNLFDVRKEMRGAQFSVKRYGHGIGLCQTGAAALARLGYSFQQILAHYFPNTEIRSKS